MRVLGLMSGTSADGIDAALCEISGDEANLRAEIVSFECVALPDSLRERVLRAGENLADVREITLLHRDLGRVFGAAAREIQKRFGRAQLVASHGQTVCHLGDQNATLQLGDAATICEIAGCDVVSNFRARDLAAGGRGAPLVPYVDWCLLRVKTPESPRTRAVLNLGGIANATILPPDCALENVFASDIGPANMVIDALAAHFFGAKFDRNGDFAAHGTPDEKLLEHLLARPFFARQAPKTAGREEFGAEFLAPFLALQNPSDALATATQFSARAVADFLRKSPEIAARNGEFDLVLGGGGAHNATLVRALENLLPRARLRFHEEFGISSDAKEALAFAVLGYQSWHGVPTNLPSVTGAKRRVVLGEWTKFGA